MTEYEFRVRNWRKFQHYGKRNPPWIKNYKQLLSTPEYLRLTPTRRALLHGLWLWWAERYGDAEAAGGFQRLDRGGLNICLQLAAKMSDYEALNHAGFIELRASNTLAPRYQLASAESERELKEPKSGSSRTALDHAEQPAGDWGGLRLIGQTDGLRSAAERYRHSGEPP